MFDTQVAVRPIVPQRMHLSGTVTKIWSHDNDLLESCDVIGHVTIRLVVVDFLWMVHCDNVSIWHHYGDMAV